MLYFYQITKINLIYYIIIYIEINKIFKIFLVSVDILNSEKIIGFEIYLKFRDFSKIF